MTYSSRVTTSSLGRLTLTFITPCSPANGQQPGLVRPGRSGSLWMTEPSEQLVDVDGGFTDRLQDSEAVLGIL